MRASASDSSALKAAHCSSVAAASAAAAAGESCTPSTPRIVDSRGNNVFDKDYTQVGFNGLYQVDLNDDTISVYDAFLGAPRTWGATLRMRY